MDKEHYNEMIFSLKKIEEERLLTGKKIFVFGHCNATENLVDQLLLKGFHPEAILDNNSEKYGHNYRGIKIVAPQAVVQKSSKDEIVLVVARAYSSMAEQLKKIGYEGTINKLVDYNSYAEYSLSSDTIKLMKKRLDRGIDLYSGFAERHAGEYKVLCPFAALGDVYIMMSYLPRFLNKRGIDRCVVGVVGDACKEVVELFDFHSVEKYAQNEMDEMIQTALYMQDNTCFIPHQDRPYVIDLNRALYLKKISIYQMYRCGIFGLANDVKPVLPVGFRDYCDLKSIPMNKSVILSPYAKSVTLLPTRIWSEIISCYNKKGYRCYTNIINDEKPLAGTIPISPSILEMRSIVERAGTFIGIRSGLCDVIQTASARKIALYPDYYYSDTRWKAVDIYKIDNWQNIVVGKDYVWRDN